MACATDDDNKKKKTVREEKFQATQIPKQSYKNTNNMTFNHTKSKSIHCLSTNENLWVTW